MYLCLTFLVIFADSLVHAHETLPSEAFLNLGWNDLKSNKMLALAAE